MDASEHQPFIPAKPRRPGRRRRRQQRRQRCTTRQFQGHFTWPYACLSPSRALGQKRNPKHWSSKPPGLSRRFRHRLRHAHSP